MTLFVFPYYSGTLHQLIYQGALYSVECPFSSFLLCILALQKTAPFLALLIAFYFQEAFDPVCLSLGPRPISFFKNQPFKYPYETLHTRLTHDCACWSYIGLISCMCIILHIRELPIDSSTRIPSGLPRKSLRLAME